MRSGYTKGLFYESGRIIPGTDNVVSTRDPAKHRALRAKMGGAYLERGNLLAAPNFDGTAGGETSFERGVDRQLAKLVSLIDEKYVSGPGEHKALELSTRAMFFTLDVISDVSFGSPFGFLAEDRDLYQFIEIHDAAVPVMNVLQALPGLTNVVYRWPMRLALPSTGDKVGLGRLMGLAKEKVEERFRPGAKPGHDMLQAFINGGMTYDELVQHMFVQM